MSYSEFTEINLGNWDQSRVFCSHVFFFSEWFFNLRDIESFTTYHYSRRFLLGIFVHIRVQFFNSRWLSSWAQKMFREPGQLGVFEVVRTEVRTMAWLDVLPMMQTSPPLAVNRIQDRTASTRGAGWTWHLVDLLKTFSCLLFNVQVFVSRAANILGSCFGFTTQD